MNATLTKLEGTAAAAAPQTVKPENEPDRTAQALETASGCPRDFLDQQFVYVVISPRARGLSIGINVNPDKYCNFDCVYCEVDRTQPPRQAELDVEVMAAELKQTLDMVHSERVRQRPWYASLPAELLQLRHVALSGDGEPTLSPKFLAAVEGVVHVRALGQQPFFKMVLLTNGTGLDNPAVQEGLSHFRRADEIWIKLEAGTEAYMQQVNRPRGVTLDQIMKNIVLIGRKRPVVIQSLFPSIHDEAPPATEIEAYAERLQELAASGAQISLVQIYSATRPMAHIESGHLSLRVLSQIAQLVRQRTGLRVEVF